MPCKLTTYIAKQKQSNSEAVSGDPTFLHIPSLRKATHRPSRPGRYAKINETRDQITSMTKS